MARGRITIKGNAIRQFCKPAAKGSQIFNGTHRSGNIVGLTGRDNSRQEGLLRHRIQTRSGANRFLLANRYGRLLSCTKVARLQS
jgi:hypothetical protein